MTDPTHIPLMDSEPLERWKREQTETMERPKQEARHRYEQSAADGVRTEMYALVREVRGEMEAKCEILQEACGEELGEVMRQVTDSMEGAIQRVERMLFTEIAKRFAELSARLDMMPGGGRKDFKFACEKSEESEPVQDLPNPISRRDIN